MLNRKKKPTLIDGVDVVEVVTLLCVALESLTLVIDDLEERISQLEGAGNPDEDEEVFLATFTFPDAADPFLYHGEL